MRKYAPNFELDFHLFNRISSTHSLRHFRNKGAEYYTKVVDEGEGKKAVIPADYLRSHPALAKPCHVPLPRKGTV
jgi:hypothetical protein